MKSSVRAWPFESKYLRDFAVVEEHRGDLRFLPATEQLPLLSKAIDEEFYAGLTPRLAATDARGDVLRKILLKEAAEGFCTILNGARPDHLHVQPFYTREGVTQLSILQQITKIEPQGNLHQFRQFRGETFLPNVYLSGKRLVFASHVFGRFDERAASFAGAAVVEFWDTFIGAVLAVMLVDGRPAFVLHWLRGLVAWPFRETDEEFLVVTTLSANEINRLEPITPYRGVYFHYGPEFVPPAEDGMALVCEDLLMRWKHPAPLIQDFAKAPVGGPWIKYCQIKAQGMAARGYGEGSRLYFRANIYGPGFHSHPGQPPASRSLPAPSG